VTKERPITRDLTSQLIQENFDDPNKQRMLFQEGEEKNELVQNIVSRIVDRPFAQKDFLKKLFDEMADQGTSWKEIERRETALAIISHTAMIPVLDRHPLTIHSVYLSAIKEQHANPDCFDGSIAALLEVGQYIAPYLPKTFGKQKQIRDAWQELCMQFPEKDQRDAIQFQFEKIALSAKRKSPHTIPPEQVKELFEQELSYRQIADKLDISRTQVKDVVSKLVKSHEIKPREQGNHTANKENSHLPRQRKRKLRLKPEVTNYLTQQVKELRQQGLNNREIEASLGGRFTIIQIERIASHLIKAGEIERHKARRRPESERQKDKQILIVDLTKHPTLH